MVRVSGKSSRSICRLEVLVSRRLASIPAHSFPLLAIELLISPGCAKLLNLFLRQLNSVPTWSWYISYCTFICPSSHPVCPFFSPWHRYRLWYSLEVPTKEVIIDVYIHSRDTKGHTMGQETEGALVLLNHREACILWCRSSLSCHLSCCTSTCSTPRLPRGMLGLLSKMVGQGEMSGKQYILCSQK